MPLDVLREKSTDLASKLVKNALVTTPEIQRRKSFKGSQGFIVSWKERHNLSSMVPSGEGDVRLEQVNKARIEIPELLKQYEARDIYNLDELALFYNNCNK